MNLCDFGSAVCSFDFVSVDVFGADTYTSQIAGWNRFFNVPKTIGSNDMTYEFLLKFFCIIIDSRDGNF